jgi:glutamyl-tRNA synthetase
VAKVMQERAKTLKEMAANSRYFFEDVRTYDEKAARKNLTVEALAGLKAVHERFASLSEWQASSIHEAINEVAASLGLGLGKIAQPVRVAVTGGSVSPPIDVTLEALGREAVLERLKRAIDYIQGG